MLCKNCLHSAELHDENEGYCNAKIYHSEALENASVPETCDCPAFEPERETTQVDQGAVRKLRRIQAIETLLAIERRLLEEQGRHSSKRSRKLEERLRRVVHSSEETLYTGDDAEESDAEDMTEVDAGEAASVTTGSIPRRARGELAEPTYEELKARVTELEKLVVRRRFGALEFKIGEKGGVSVYGLGRFPVTLYYEQWDRLLNAGGPLRAFLEENKTAGKLKLKQK
jgi:hypothetical protein